jgi:undecaprenyl-diphosphatase
VKAVEAIALGIVQGITEFLPISSSAHLILTSHYLGWSDQGLFFDMAANTGSLLAVIAYLRRDLAQMASGFMQWLTAPRSVRRHRFAAAKPALLLAAATIPVGAAGLVLRPLIAGWARDPLVIATTSIVFGLLLWWADSRRLGTRLLPDLTFPMALAIGLAQALALVPGTSRAGVTLTAALFLGLGRESAVRFSFLLAVPVGLLVAGKQAVEIGLQQPAVETVGVGALALGLVAAAVSAYAAITWLVAWVRRQNLLVFVVYRLILGAAILLGLAL